MKVIVGIFTLLLALPLAAEEILVPDSSRGADFQEVN
jgi:hypothetical protein